MATKAEEPAVIRAAQQFEEARQTLNRYRLERQKLDEEMKAATHRMSEAANVLRAEIESMPEARPELRRLVPKISVVTPFLNGIDLLPDYIAATLGAELILVDNGSDEETRAALQELPPDRGVVIRNEQNLGFAAANNQGYAAATGDIIIFLNSDIAGDPSWLKLVADDVQDGALYGPSLAVQLVYGLRIPYLEGWCVAATRATWERVCWPDDYDPEGNPRDKQGPWDHIGYPGPYWEDNDLCLRAMDANQGLIQTAWPIQHKGGRTAGALVKHGATFEQNRATFVARVNPVWERTQHAS